MKHPKKISPPTMSRLVLDPPNGPDNMKDVDTAVAVGSCYHASNCNRTSFQLVKESGTWLKYESR